MASKPKLTDSRKINKTAWIKSQPADLSALTLVAKAKSAGFTISPGQIYTARSEARKRVYATSHTNGAKVDTKKPGSQAEPRHGRIAIVLGTATMNVTEIMQGLKDAGDPAKSRDAVNQVLVDGVKAKRFVRTERGHYRVALAPEAIRSVPSQRREVAVASNGQRDVAAEVRRLVRLHGTLQVRAVLDEIERE